MLLYWSTMMPCLVYNGAETASQSARVTPTWFNIPIALICPAATVTLSNTTFRAGVEGDVPSMALNTTGANVTLPQIVCVSQFGSTMKVLVLSGGGLARYPAPRYCSGN